MFDNLRDEASSFYEEEQNDLYQEQAARPAVSRPRRRSTRFLGMTAQQRFLLSLMLMVTICIMGVVAMFVMGRMSLF